MLLPIAAALGRGFEVLPVAALSKLDIKVVNRVLATQYRCIRTVRTKTILRGNENPETSRREYKTISAWKIYFF
jgi:hypothetical protein